ncbi:hypothetical protein ASPZODRAFT_1030471 [Penicilliopsis zonata CBS 506.65]|uniref:Uncharacterized protein n=1 Tax=Penicilliopsis zonata CBS 506.65 TaxID=1073090 RepID=A0A1L9SRP5_9EURO|nr:hypothetical protein ASPZODRAFT_1030471 [Penicilliopsis zonata CBS 506.65]OJJ49794.1 hypothetical protein ASPZODRAFT_1030471 [Penicilliopsis zonata CBS 506.65]
MNPLVSWALLLVVAGGLGYYYTNGPNAKGKPVIKPLLEKVDNIPAAAKKQKRKVRKSPEPAAAPARPVEATPVIAVTENERPEQDVDQKEMARRLTAAKNGTPLATSAGNKKKKAGSSERSVSSVSTRTSSTAGADADDDLSPATSPVVQATVPGSAGYVSDMLEAPAPAASVLRVTGSLPEEQPKKQKAQTFKPVETKKQRQQRLKNEARKQQVQEAEEQRRKLLEKQMHTARESERREAAAKAQRAPTTNAWAAKDVTNVASSSSSSSAPAAAAKNIKKTVELLDTFDAKENQPVSSSSSKWTQEELPTEEEQLRLLGASTTEDEWTTVSKKPKKKGGKTDESVSEASASESQPYVAAAAAPAVKPVELPAVTQVYIPDILRNQGKGHPLDSDWAA